MSLKSQISELNTSIQERMYGIDDDKLYPIAIKTKNDKILFYILGLICFVIFIIIIIFLVRKEEEKEEEKKK
jgi:phosphotransferase system  glucose/maltose/N-acetylglucosamine-specific IIC component